MLDQISLVLTTHMCKIFYATQGALLCKNLALNRVLK